MHSGRCLINSALIAGSSHEPETLLHFHTYENPYIRLYKNTCEEAREPGQIADARMPVEQGEHPDAVASSLKVSWATIYRVLRWCVPGGILSPNRRLDTRKKGDKVRRKVRRGSGLHCGT